MHKRKNERRVNAMLEGRRKQKRENLKAKQTEREELRKQYNSYAKVPILPDYTYRLPDFEDDEDSDAERDAMLEMGEISSDDDEDLVSAKETRRNAKAFPQ
mgnify:CR=1 FL=1